MIEYNGEIKSTAQWARIHGIKPSTLHFRVRKGMPKHLWMLPVGAFHRGHYWGETIENVFWKYVSPEPNSGCWLWDGPLNGYGYGRFSFEKKDYMAHRLSYELHRTQIPEGMQIDHLCRVRCCVNPDHLEIVSPGENTVRGWQAANYERPEARRSHCPKGHPYSGDNLYVSPKGFKECRTCKRETNRRSRQRLKSRC